MKRVVRTVLILAGLVLLVGAGIFVWATVKVSGLRSRTIETHAADFPVPFPLSGEEREELVQGEDPEEVAWANAIERGSHLVEARYACAECHGADFGGGVMVDDPMMGSLLGPNITTGAGSKALGYGPADWDRAVRHGVKPGGLPSVMPSEDFQLMSDQELSDIVAYLGALPPVDNDVPEVRLGPLGRVLMAMGQIYFSADIIESHTADHPAVPPSPEVSAEFGRHLAGVCTGCHGVDLAGGRVPGGDPSWPPAANLTPHSDGLAGWTLDDFRRVMLQGVRPDGSSIREPMTSVMPYAANMTEVEMEALWTYVQGATPAADS